MARKRRSTDMAEQIIWCLIDMEPRTYFQGIEIDEEDRISLRKVLKLIRKHNRKK